VRQRITKAEPLLVLLNKSLQFLKNNFNCKTNKYQRQSSNPRKYWIVYCRSSVFFASIASVPGIFAEKRGKKSISSSSSSLVDHLRLYLSVWAWVTQVERNLLKYDILTLFIYFLIRKISHVWTCVNKSRAIHHNFHIVFWGLFCLFSHICIRLH
jgi:hypothetical protein